MKNWTEHPLTRLLASLGVIISLLLVVVEIRETRSIAQQQAVADNWQNWNDVYAMEVQPELVSAWARIMTQPDQVTIEDKIVLNAWLYAVTGAYHQDFSAMQLLGQYDTADDVLTNLAGDVPMYFGNQVARDWFWANTWWMDPKIIEVIENGISNQPVGGDRAYFGKLGSGDTR